MGKFLMLATAALLLSACNEKEQVAYATRDAFYRPAIEECLDRNDCAGSFVFWERDDTPVLVADSQEVSECETVSVEFLKSRRATLNGFGIFGGFVNASDPGWKEAQEKYRRGCHPRG